LNSKEDAKCFFEKKVTGRPEESLRLDEVDLHFGRRDRSLPYDEVMADMKELVRTALAKAQDAGRAYVMFVHGQSTSGPGKMTARSVVRQFMRLRETTPYVVKRGCIQHPVIFFAEMKLTAESD
jgi:hypothetical protein